MSILYVPLSKEQKSFCEDFVRDRVTHLRAAYTLKRGFRAFRIQVMNGEDNPGGVIAKKQMRKWLQILPEIRAIQNRPQDILGNRTVLQAMVEGYSRIVPLALRRISCHFRRDDDLVQEGNIALIDAVYSYNKNYYFSTYCHKVIKSHIINYLKKRATEHNWFSNEKYYQLYISYRDKCSEANRRVNFEEVVSMMQLSDKDRKKLEEILNFSVLSGNQTPAGESVDIVGDYTTTRSQNRVGCSEYNWKLANNEEGEWSESELKEMKRKLNKAIAKAELSPFEKDLVLQAKDPYHGWQSDVCKRNINPKTGKPYSRMAASIVLPKIFAKLRRLMEAA